MAANATIPSLPMQPAAKQGGLTSLQIFSTCPSSLDCPERYTDRIIQAAEWSERAGCVGMLVYTDNSLADPWLVSQIVIQHTRWLAPLVAVQPVYMHPYSVAKMAATIAFLYQRRIYLNMVAGGFKNDLVALNDTTPHDERYTRLIEYTEVIQRLVEGGPVTFEGQFYSVHRLSLSPGIPDELRPGFLMSGSSEAGLQAAHATHATAVGYPEPPESGSPAENGPSGVRIGIVTRPKSADAWAVARARFPYTRKGQMTRQLATKVSDSAWHKTLSAIGDELAGSARTYWLEPFENYQTNCPYLVGDYGEVARELARYISFGHRTFILDIPSAEEEFEHTAAAFRAASGGAVL